MTMLRRFMRNWIERFFGVKEKGADPLSMEYLLKEAGITGASPEVYLMAQYTYEDPVQAQRITGLIESGETEGVYGYYNEDMCTDLLMLYLVVAQGKCTMLIVYDPFELFDNPRLIATVNVDECAAVKACALKDLTEKI